MQFHPLASEYPMMPAYELGRLEEAMREFGYDPRFPIVTYEGMILDGRNRWLAAQRAGVKPKLIEFKGTEEEARRFAQTANEERRHLAPAWLESRRAERIERVAAARREGKPTRQIAEEEGVSQPQVIADIKKAGDKGLSPEPLDGKVTGKDGVKQPAKKPPKPPTPQQQKRIDRDCGVGVRNLIKDGKLSGADAVKVAQQPPELQDGILARIQQGAPVTEAIAQAREDYIAEPDPAIVDALGIPIPPGAAESFAALDQFAKCRRLARQLADELHELATLPGGFRFMRQCCESKAKKADGPVRYEVAGLRAILHQLKEQAPHTSVCPHCWAAGSKKNRKDCECCHGLPFVSREQFGRCGDDLQRQVEKLAKGGAA